MYTLDSRFVLSGSDDSNLRIWKARASEKLGTVDKREMARKEYRDGLREKWGSVAEVAKLERCVLIDLAPFSTQSFANLTFLIPLPNLQATIPSQTYSQRRETPSHDARRSRKEGREQAGPRTQVYRSLVAQTQAGEEIAHRAGGKLMYGKGKGQQRVWAMAVLEEERIFALEF